MALVDVGGALRWPYYLFHAVDAGSGVTFDTFTIDASAEKASMKIPVPKTGTLESVGFRLGAVGQAPTNGLKVSFQDIDHTTGDPDGTVDQFRVVTAGLTANAWVDVSDTGAMTVDGGAGAKRSVTIGDELFVVIEFESFNASDSLEISAWRGSGVGSRTNYPYVDHFTSSWAKSLTAVCNVSLKYDDGTYAFIPQVGCASAIASTGVSLDTGTDPDEVALRFIAPFPCRVIGAQINCDLDGDADAVLYDTDGTTPLLTRSLDLNDRSSTTRAAFQFLFPGTADLSLGGEYHLAIKPTSLTNITVPHFDVDANVIFDQMGGGSDMHWAQRVDGGSWVDTITRRLFASLLLSHVDNGAGGGAVLISRPRRII